MRLDAGTMPTEWQASNDTDRLVRDLPVCLWPPGRMHLPTAGFLVIAAHAQYMTSLLFRLTALSVATMRLPRSICTYSIREEEVLIRFVSHCLACN